MSICHFYSDASLLGAGLLMADFFMSRLAARAKVPRHPPISVMWSLPASLGPNHEDLHGCSAQSHVPLSLRTFCSFCLCCSFLFIWQVPSSCKTHLEQHLPQNF